MTVAFDSAVAIVLEEEGVFSDNRNDPGGETRFGISKAAFPTIDIATLTVDQAKAIYRASFWDAHRCGEMPWAWGLAVFDGAVNQGTKSVRMAQLALQTADDGKIGAGTLAAMHDKGADDAFLGFLALRADAYRLDAHYDTFGHGWLKRLFRVAQCGEHAPAP